MKFVRILLVVIAGVLGLDVEGMQPQAPVQTVFDLPTDTPGLLLDKQVKKVCGEDKECVHVIVPGTSAEWARDRGIVESMAVDGNIYFPADGTQPTTEEAAKYSCANIDAYNENSPITEWYMEMFGYGGNVKTGKTFIKVGYTDPLSQESIVATLENVLSAAKGVSIVNISELQTPYTMSTEIIKMSDRNNNVLSQQFWAAFRAIAADPVGMVLLYRILIEIARRDEFSGVCEMSVYDTDAIIRRNHCRSIVIRQAESPSNCAFGMVSKVILFNGGNIKLSAIKIKNTAEIRTVECSTSADIVLFHELLHWYQFLRNPIRCTNEIIKAPTDNNRHYMIKCYYDYIPDLWELWNCNAEENEMRVILGSPDYRKEQIRELIGKTAFCPGQKDSLPNYIIDKQQVHIARKDIYYEGDDLSENVYRMSRYIYTCFSHYNATQSQKHNRREGTPPITSEQPTVAPPMRWGHTNQKVVLKDISNRFKLANLIARKCYHAIVGEHENTWDLQSGEASL